MGVGVHRPTQGLAGCNANAKKRRPVYVLLGARESEPQPCVFPPRAQTSLCLLYPGSRMRIAIIYDM